MIMTLQGTRQHEDPVNWVKLAVSGIIELMNGSMNGSMNG